MSWCQIWFQYKTCPQGKVLSQLHTILPRNELSRAPVDKTRLSHSNHMTALVSLQLTKHKTPDVRRKPRYIICLSKSYMCCSLLENMYVLRRGLIHLWNRWKKQGGTGQGEATDVHTIVSMFKDKQFATVVLSSLNEYSFLDSSSQHFY